MKMYKMVTLGYNCYSTISNLLSNVCVLQKKVFIFLNNEKYHQDDNLFLTKANIPFLRLYGYEI